MTYYDSAEKCFNKKIWINIYYNLSLTRIFTLNRTHKAKTHKTSILTPINQNWIQWKILHKKHPFQINFNTLHCPKHTRTSIKVKKTIRPKYLLRSSSCFSIYETQKTWLKVKNLKFLGNLQLKKCHYLIFFTILIFGKTYLIKENHLKMLQNVHFIKI